MTVASCRGWRDVEWTKPASRTCVDDVCGPTVVGKVALTGKDVSDETLAVIVLHSSGATA